MGKVLSPEFQKLLQDRKLTKFKPDKKLVLKEISAAKSDLKDAKESMNRKKFKWATIQGYYSMFHSARAVLFDKGYRGKEPLLAIGSNKRALSKRNRTIAHSRIRTRHVSETGS
jgi:predicted fused transcriptional regulator/phosphomethylpyrimidine kinase